MAGVLLDPKVHDPKYVHKPSKIVDAAKLDWQSTQYAGFDFNVLLVTGCERVECRRDQGDS